MSSFKKQTYDNSYFFSLPGEMKNHHKKITKFILKAQRIENKSADNFRGIVEDVKRYQQSSILYSILMRDDVVLCYDNVEMSAAFKVFSAKDLKNGDGNKVFIDVTTLITVKNGDYVCNNLGKLCTYLFQAITWLLYDINPLALMNNSNVTLSATESFVAMFDYLIGYFRFYGYSDNRQKILYLAALYFLIRVMGKDDDQYTENLAAKIAGVASNNVKPFSLYYNATVDFININTFIEMLAKTFKLKGLTTEVFIGKWIYICGTGTQFAPELFTAFSNMMIAAYCGTNIVNHRSIENQTASSMIKFADAIKKLGIDNFEGTKIYMGESELDSYIARDKNTVALAEAISKRDIPDKAKFDKEDCKSKAKAKAKITEIIKWCKSTKQENKISSKIVSAAKLAISCMDRTRARDQYEIGVLDVILHAGKKYLSGKDKDVLFDQITTNIRSQTDYMREARDSGNKELSDKLSNQMTELFKCKSIL